MYALGLSHTVFLRVAVTVRMMKRTIIYLLVPVRISGFYQYLSGKVLRYTKSNPEYLYRLYNIVQAFRNE